MAREKGEQTIAAAEAHVMVTEARYLEKLTKALEKECNPDKAHLLREMIELEIKRIKPCLK